MGKARSPRHGSMQFWPRKRARRAYPRIRKYASSTENKIIGFAGYKVGMTHILIKSTRPNSMTLGESIFRPVTIIECPPLKVAAIRFYKRTVYGLKAVNQILSKNLDKNLKRKMLMPKKETNQKEPENYDDIRLLVYTQPNLTGIGKKKPEIFEIAVGGTKEQQLAYAREKLGKEITATEILKPGKLVDVHAVTKGKGLQGVVKRFGVSLKSHKSEKKKRSVGNLGPWIQSAMWRVPQPGQMGYHTRTDYNKLIIKVSDKPDEINPKSGFKHYSIVKNSYILVKGSIQGPAKRLVRLNNAIRPHKRKHSEIFEIEYINIQK